MRRARERRVRHPPAHHAGHARLRPVRAAVDPVRVLPPGDERRAVQRVERVWGRGVQRASAGAQYVSSRAALWRAVRSAGGAGAGCDVAELCRAAGVLNGELG